MEAPPVQFVTTDDGKVLAYTVTGAGRSALVLVPNTFMHVRWAWMQYPDLLRGLAERFRLVHFNYRGHGMSTRGLPQDHSMADWQRDMATVMDTAEVASGVLMAPGHAGHIAVRYTLSHPDRVKGLILFAPSIKMNAWTESLMRGVSAENWDLYLRNLVPYGVTSERFEALLHAYHETETQAEFQVAIQEIFRWDLTDELSRLTVPTLVLHPRGLITLPMEESQRFAAAVPGSRFVVVDGASGIFGDAVHALIAIDDFTEHLRVKHAAPAEIGEPMEPSYVEERVSDRATEPTIGLNAARFSPREMEILRLLGAGKSNQEIADELVISLNTVRRHVSNIFGKAGIANRAQAAIYARDHGFV
jgi:pimeloyl-ACP methyl ester carboxylesterase/DNA-binding CsgD family transcriptional regulator